MLIALGSELIRLPVELKQVEDRMNEARQNVARNARLAREAEQRKNDLVMYLAHDIKTPLTYVPEDMTIYGDPDKLARVFNNVLKNAVAYSPDNSVI